VESSLVNDPLQDFKKWNEEMVSRFNPDDYHKRSVFPVRLLEKRRVAEVVRMLDPQPEDRILEIGSGAGNLVEALPCGTIVGVDLSYSLLSIAERKTYRAEVNWIRCYGERTPFPDEAFDKVYCSEVLEHVPDPREICREGHRVLKTGGRFVFSVPNERSINLVKRFLGASHLAGLVNALSGYKFSSDMTDQWHLHCFDMECARSVVHSIFEIEEICFLPARIFALRIVVRCRKKSG